MSDMKGQAQTPAGPAVTVTAWVFALTFVESRHAVGLALVCPDARYAAVQWLEQRVERRHLTGSMWSSVEADLREGFEPGAMSKSRPVARVLSGSRGAVLDVEYVRHRDVSVPASAPVADVLDKLLLSQVRPD